MKVEPAVRLAGRVAVPGDKSISHRAVLVAALCEGDTRIEGFGRSEDTEATVRAMRQVGVRVDMSDGDTLLVHGVALRGLGEPDEAIDCANAGTLMRLLAGILAGQEGSFELVGDASLSARPMERVVEPLRRMGARVDTNDGHAPIRIEGSVLSPITYELPVASAQVKSAVLLAGLLARDGETTVVEPVATRDHTESLLELAGARIARRPESVTVWPADRLALGELEIPGDFSSAAPFVLAGTLLEGSELYVHGVNLNPRRTGLLTILERMGARGHRSRSAPHLRRACGRPRGSTRGAPRPTSPAARFPLRSTSCRSSRLPRHAHPATASCAARRSCERRRATVSTRSSRV